MTPRRFIGTAFGSLVLGVYFLIRVTSAGESADPISVDAELSMPATPDHLVPLQPYPADWEIAYTKHLTEHLGLDEFYVARMIVMPSFGAEYLVRIRGDKKSYAIESSKSFFVTCAVSDESIWYSMPDNNDEKIQKPIRPTVFEAPIPVEVAHRICRIWDEMILGTRYPRVAVAGVDGVTIEFASIYGHGEVWTPGDGTSPALLWSAGESLIAYSKGSEKERKALLDAINKSIGKLEAHLKKQAEQGGARQPTTAPDSKSEGSEKTKPESEGRSQ